MKNSGRSKLFMWGYLFFLVFALIVVISENTRFYDEDDISKILTSVVFSSILFTISDLFTSLANAEKNLREAVKNLCDWLEPFPDRLDGKLPPKVTAEQLRNDLVLIRNNHNSPSIKEKRYHRVGSVFFFIGTFCICILLGFTHISGFLSAYLDIITICAFIFIILNYLLSERFEHQLEASFTFLQEMLQGLALGIASGEITIDSSDGNKEDGVDVKCDVDSSD